MLIVFMVGFLQEAKFATFRIAHVSMYITNAQSVNSTSHFNAGCCITSHDMSITDVISEQNINLFCQILCPS